MALNVLADAVELAAAIAKRAWRAWSRERRLNVDFLDVLALSASIGQGHLLAGCGYHPG